MTLNGAGLGRGVGVGGHLPVDWAFGGSIDK